MASGSNSDFKSVAFNCIDANSKDLENLALFLHENPELAYKEFLSHNYLTDFLERNGFEVEREFIHKTGFRGNFKTAEKPHFAILVEYDALPKIGHACGHNIIAQSSVATALGIRAAMTDAGLKCRISVIGTPAEEGGGGKVKFVTEGVFDDVDIAIMSHPFKLSVVFLHHLALIGYQFDFIGRESHASLAPWEGRNALDAAVMTYQAISNMRQQIRPDCRVHGIISKGGEAPNIIPARTQMQYYIRAPTAACLTTDLAPRVLDCARAAAVAAGCECVVTELCPLYADLIKPGPSLYRLFEDNATLADLELASKEHTAGLSGSSDVGNVSHVCVMLQPMFHIGTDAENHTERFAACAGSKDAAQKGLQQAKAMCGTLIDLALDDKLLKCVQAEHRANLETS